MEKNKIETGEIFYDNIIEHIRLAQIQAEKNHIKANMIIIDTGIAMTNYLFVYNDLIPPIIWGLKVEYKSNLAKDYGVNFAISNKPEYQLKENEEEKKEIKELKRLLKNAKISRTMLKRSIRKLKGK